MVILLAAGGILAVGEFLVISLLIGRGTIVGFQNGLLAGGGVVVSVVVLVWLATSVLKPKASEFSDRSSEAVETGKA